MEWDDKDFPDRNGTDRMPTFRKRDAGLRWAGEEKRVSRETRERGCAVQGMTDTPSSSLFLLVLLGLGFCCECCEGMMLEEQIIR